jgi:xylulokinase
VTLESVNYPQEASAVGAALIAAVGMGVVPSIEAVKAMVPAAEIVEPDPGSRTEYEQLYGAFKCIYPALRKICHTLN